MFTNVLQRAGMHSCVLFIHCKICWKYLCNINVKFVKLFSGLRLKVKNVSVILIQKQGIVMLPTGGMRVYEQRRVYEE